MSQSVIALFDDAIASIDRHPQFAFDIETTGLNPFKDQLLVLSLATEDGAWAIPFAGPVPHVPWRDPEVFKRIAHVFSDPNKLAISWNGGFDIRFLTVCGFEIKTKDADGMVAAWLLDETLARTRLIGLKKQAKILLGVNMDEFESTRLIEGIVDPHALQYAANDAKYTYIIWADHLFAKLQDAGLLKVFERISMPMIRVLVEMEINGCNIDVNRLKKVEQELVKQNDSVLGELRTMSGNPKFNPGSSKQLATLLFGPNSVLKVPVRRGHEWKLKSRQWATDKQTLRRYKKDHPLFEKLTEYRKSKKLLTTYAIPLQERAKLSHDGRVRSNFRLTGTVTGRLCIAKGTMIDVTRDVSKYPAGIPIEDVRPGGYAYCYDDKSQLAFRRICWAGKTGHKHVIRVHWIRDDNQVGGFVDMTPEHRIRVADGSYVAAAAAVPGTRVLGRSLDATDGHIGLSQHIPTNGRTITAIEDRGDIVSVYDIEVEGCHNFIAGGICCHNSSNGPNFQNISSKGGIREAFISAPGTKLVVADYNQLELRMGGFLAYRVFGESHIVDQYAKGIDLHEATRRTYDAMGVDRFNEAAVGAEEARRNAKICNFGYFYGRSADAFAQANPEVPYSEATTLREMFLTKLYPEIVRMHDHCVKDIVETGRVKLITGRLRRFPFCYGRDPSDVWWDGWVAWNSLVQGSSQDIIQIAMRDIFADICAGRRGEPVNAGSKMLHFPASVWALIKLLVQVHDELVMEAPAEVADDVAVWMSHRMGNAIRTPIIEFPAEAGIGDDWVAAKNAPKQKKTIADGAADVVDEDDEDDEDDIEDGVSA